MAKSYKIPPLLRESGVKKKYRLTLIKIVQLNFDQLALNPLSISYLIACSYQLPHLLRISKNVRI